MKTDLKEYHANYQANARAKLRDIQIPKCANKARRARLEKDTPKWLRYYFGGWFSKPFGPNQIEIIKDLDYHIENKSTKCVAMDRGGGKTTIGKGCTLKGILEGKIRFGFVVTSTGMKAKEFLKMLVMTFEINPRLIEDYPEVCVPFVKLKGKAQAAAGQTVDGKKTFIGISDGIVFPAVEGSRCSNSVIKADGITSAQRGAQFQTSDGVIIRPDFIFFDDAQTDDSSRSESQTNARENIVMSMMGMAEAGEKIGGYMACTVINHDDLSSRFLDRKRHPEWYGTIYRMVNKWPDTKDTLWAEYLELRRDDMATDDRAFTKSRMFYDEHFDEMNKGADVAWEGRKYEADRTAIQSAFHLVLTVGGWSTFMAEYQNEPITEDTDVYDITPDIVASRVNGFNRYAIPIEAKFLVAMCDINFVGINYCVCAFTNDFTGWVVDYGKYPEGGSVLIQKNTSETDITRIVAQGVLAVSRLLDAKQYTFGGKPVKINRTLVDGNKWTKSVFSAVKAINRPQTFIVDRGTAASRYRWQKNLIVGTPFHHCHYEENNPQKGRQIRHNSDYWRMTAQKAFLLAPGVPGSLSVYGNTPQEHRRFAEEVCGEKLIRFEPGDPVDLYHWTLKPGQANDLLDCVVGCYVAAATLGACLPGHEQNHVEQRKKPRRRPKVGIDG